MRLSSILLTLLSIPCLVISVEVTSLRGSAKTKEIESKDNATTSRRVDSIRKLTPTSDKKHDTSDMHPSPDKTDVELFYELAKGLPPPVTDKVTDHAYAEMYGTFLLPYLRRHHHLLNKGVKFLEIGLGCNMYAQGAIASPQLWQAILTDQDELWEAEYDAECVKLQREKGRLDGVKTVTGDQGNEEVLQRWIKETGGKFDIIVDDGGHHNDQIYDSFMNLWPELKPGGLYFIEDLQVGRVSTFADKSTRGIIMVDIIYAWIEQLVIGGDIKSDKVINGHQIPKDIRMIICQNNACVISKCDGKAGTNCS